ncbi:MAG: hypothetical protein HQK49_16010 [Oligoflexia bacterium]|nr:hypothetical protein [Oligoflexia bacterium]
MLLIYLLWLLFSGYSLTLVLITKSDSDNDNDNDNLLLRFAITPLLAILLPSLLIYILNIVSIKITTVSLLVPWITIIFAIAFWYRKNLIESYQEIKGYFLSYKIFGRILLILLSLTMLSLYVRVAISDIWVGDGMIHWGLKAHNWSYLGKILYSPWIEKDLALWTHYPLYHSVGMLVNIVSLPLPYIHPAFAVKLFDAIYMYGIFFTSLFFLKFATEFRRSLLLIFSLALTFGVRDIPSAMISGYADIDQSYYIFLGCTLIAFMFFYEEKISPSLLFILSLIFVLAMITKVDGLYRVLIIIFWIFFMMVFNGGFVPKLRKLNLISIIFLLLPLLLLYLDQISRPLVVSSSGGQFFDEMINDPLLIAKRIPNGIISLYYSLSSSCESIIKCSASISFVLSMVSAVYLILNPCRTYRPYGPDKLYRRRIVIFFAGIVVCNYLLNMVPVVMVNNVIDPRLNDPITYATMGFNRYNAQLFLLNNAIIIMGIDIFFQTLHASRDNLCNNS